MCVCERERHTHTDREEKKGRVEGEIRFKEKKNLSCTYFFSFNEQLLIFGFCFLIIVTSIT